MLHIANASLLFGPKAVFAPLHSPPPARFLATVALTRLEGSEPLGGVLAFVRVARSLLAVGPRGLAGLIKAFLGCVLTMGMQQRRLLAGEVVVQAHPSELREPVARTLARLTIYPVVGDECARVDCAAG